MLYCLSRHHHHVLIYHLLHPSHRHHPDLHSFPTRRSSDLGQRLLRRELGIRIRLARAGNLREALLLREGRSEEHTSELQSRLHVVWRLLLEKKKGRLTQGGERPTQPRGLGRAPRVRGRGWE